MNICPLCYTSLDIRFYKICPMCACELQRQEQENDTLVAFIKDYNIAPTQQRHCVKCDITTYQTIATVAIPGGQKTIVWLCHICCTQNQNLLGD